jgi:hypothetical protein
MKQIVIGLFRSLCILFLIFCLAQPVYAHGDEPRLEINAERIHPGGIIDVRGVGFELEELVSLSLIGEGLELPLGEIAADQEGIFLHTVALPADLAEGVYHFRAITDDHQIASPMLTVSGEPILSEGSEPLRDEEDGLLAPMPTFAPGVTPTAAAQPAVRTSVEEQPVSQSNGIMLLLSIAAVLAVFAAFRFRRAGRDSL